MIGAIMLSTSIGAAGIAAHMGQRLARHKTISPFMAFVRGALALDLATAFPRLGWIVLLPLITALSAGLALPALFGRRAVANHSEPMSMNAGVRTSAG